MKHLKLSRFIVASFSGYLIWGCSANAWALNLRFRPSVFLQEVYSDNIRLAPKGEEESAWVTAITPGFFVNGQSGRYNLNLNYRLQSIYNAGGDSDIDLNHQLQFNSNYIVSPGRFFVQSRSSISQQNISNTRIVSDNFTGDRSNTSTISTFGIAPTWTPRFGSYANGMARAGYDRVSSSEGPLSDTDSFSQNVMLNSGRYFSKVGWRLNFNNRINRNSSGEEIRFQDSNALLRYILNRKFSLLAQGGYANNDFRSTTGFSRNGFYYNFGGQWTPSQRFSVSAGYGNNSYVTVFISPFQRLQWTTTYRNNDVGTNTGNVWQTNLRYFTPQSVVNLTYNEDTTTVQQVLFEEQIIPFEDEFGEPINDADGNPILFNIALPNLIDDVFVRRRGQLSYSYRTGKSILGANVFTERRTFQESQVKDEVYGIRGSWMWNFMPRTNTFLSSGYQVTDTDFSTDNRFDVAFRVQRSILRQLNGNIEYRYINQSSNNNINSFDENRITLNLMAFF
ncbi:TIGR03016 family PEP-CTERM system-associated outer membrane protein [Methylotuvimicrobium buryatense]|uniref:TIGR03016 family PEP-CTERM system-associated outer membrane protein n=1 Tax=Methylotuvimicrobium buryatense TaxID=95641 RepID=A0A4P9UL28_METBY|nr:TIGR03016 family PEP-CTERM system-associated outer membrane protein [Methylotuvimicrobium buryatense]QCW81924.1 TIGR03016 family PEP-CTERM system-associated outer membrane protein [Methylotuvimicrobium buryatense]